MVKVVKSLEVWLEKFYPELVQPILSGEMKELSKELFDEYLEWCLTEEGAQYLYGGSKYKATAQGRRFYPVKNAPADTILPKRGSKYSAGYDFCAPCDIPVPANSSTKLIFLNVKAEMPRDEYLQLVIRSSMAVKHGIVMETSGVIDADYFNNAENDGNIGVKFRNNSDSNYLIKKGDRCCQGIFIKYGIVDDDFVTNERAGGYGSTGK